MSEPTEPTTTEDPWLPASGSPWQRLDPRSVAVQPLVAIKAGGFPALIAVFGAASQLGWFALLALPVLLLLAALFGVLSYLSTSFLVADNQIRVRRGLINRTTLTANLDKVRSVDLEAPLLHRIVGLSRVEIGTGVDDTRIQLDSLGTAQAHELRRFLLQRTATAPADGDDAPGPGTDPTAEVELGRLNPAWARYAPLKLSTLAIVAGGFGALSQVVDWETLTDLRWADSTWGWLSDQALLLVVAAGVVLAVTAWVTLSVAAYLIHWWRLRLTRTADTLRLTAGLFTTRSTSIELSRIRGLRVTRGPLIRWAEGGDLATYATGVEEGVTSILPTAPMPEVHRVGHALLGDAAPLTTPLREHGPAARARLRFRGVAATAFVAFLAADGVIIAALQPSPPGLPLLLGVAAAIVALAALLAWAAVRAAYRNLGHALTARYLVAGSGVATAAREVLEVDGIIGWVIRQSLFQRRRGLADLVATTAAGPERVVVQDVPRGRAIALANRTTPEMLAEFLADPDAGAPAQP